MLFLDCIVLATIKPEQLKLLLLKQLSAKLTRQLMRLVWRTETMVLPDHKVAITKTVQTLLSVIIQNEGRKYAL